MKKQNDELHPYKIFGLSIIHAMLLLAILGIVLTLVIKYYFPNLF